MERLDTAPSRLPRVDALRGVAIVAMVVYHFVWDLAFFGLVRVDLFGDPLWLAARTAILSSFLVLVGVGLVLAAERGPDRRRFVRRLLRLGAAAAGISAVSHLAFPASPIFFGVLHHIAVASVLGLAFLRLPAVAVAAAALAVWVAGETLAHPLFDGVWLRWIGFTTVPPDSNDYVPLFPWFAAVLAGMALAKLGAVGRVLAGPAAAPAPLAAAGRNSLAIYLIHQPVLLGALWLGTTLFAATEPAAVKEFLGQCVPACASRGQPEAYCARTCRCVADAWRRDNLFDGAVAGRLDADGRARAEAHMRACVAG